jgi:uncharacterized membrane protein YczE
MRPSHHALRGARGQSTFAELAHDAAGAACHAAGVSRLIPDRPLRRLAQLYAGLVLYGVSLALMVRAKLGLDPWDVLHQGLAERVGASFGTVVIVVGALVLLLWIPLRQMPGVGTVSNVVVIGLAADAGLALVRTPGPLTLRVAQMLAGVVLNGIAGGAYIGAGLGPGPRDGLMTGLVRRTGRSIRLIRTGIEASVVFAGWLLGGTVGVATVVYALSIGPLLHAFVPLLAIRDRAPVALPGSVQAAAASAE